MYSNDIKKKKENRIHNANVVEMTGEGYFLINLTGL